MHHWIPGAVMEFGGRAAPRAAIATALAVGAGWLSRRGAPRPRPRAQHDSAAPGGRHGAPSFSPVDEDLASAALAAELKADMLVMLTGGDFVGGNWGTPSDVPDGIVCV
ncbi:hypothetical protein [Streptomyces sp. NPDC048312]|uniref:hypothetical protein n=1 Tax=Streptomyces sp. NPDC048312 TaxID=3155485 RepID=UPI0034083B93